MRLADTGRRDGISWGMWGTAMATLVRSCTSLEKVEDEGIGFLAIPGGHERVFMIPDLPACRKVTWVAILRVFTDSLLKSMASLSELPLHGREGRKMTR